MCEKQQMKKETKIFSSKFIFLIIFDDLKIWDSNTMEI